MRTLVSIFVVSMLAGIASPQAAPSLQSDITIRKLTIESTTLPDADREEITRRFQGRTYPPPSTPATFSEEVGERIRDSFQVLGYFEASVAGPRISVIKKERKTRIIDMTVSVEEGPRYRLGEIRFRGGTVFASEEMRRAIPIQSGEVFNVEKMREGINNLRELYLTKGYVNFTPVPGSATNDSRRTVDVIFDLDEGGQFFFGPLVLDGQEPHVGAGKALLESWDKLRSKPYSSAILEQWFLRNEANLPVGKQILELVRTFPDQVSHLITVKLSFP